ncbi:MAG: hypothetical protein F6K28_62735 [Microcoleus sp. SIO2G3]|nr:hypothetical protein [Microcoleus sp. SIO2G3]
MMAGTLTTIAFLPQLIKTWRTQSAKDLSFSWLVTFSLGVSLWLLYGILIRSLPVIVSNAVTLLLTLIILWFKLREIGRLARDL